MSWVAPPGNHKAVDPRHTVAEVAEVVEMLIRAGGGVTNSENSSCRAADLLRSNWRTQELSVVDRVLFLAASEPALLPLLEAVVDGAANRFARPTSLAGRCLPRWSYEVLVVKRRADRGPGPDVRTSGTPLLAAARCGNARGVHCGRAGADLEATGSRRCSRCGGTGRAQQPPRLGLWGQGVGHGCGARRPRGHRRRWRKRRRTRLYLILYRSESRGRSRSRSSLVVVFFFFFFFFLFLLSSSSASSSSSSSSPSQAARALYEGRQGRDNGQGGTNGPGLPRASPPSRQLRRARSAARGALRGGAGPRRRSPFLCRP